MKLAIYILTLWVSISLIGCNDKPDEGTPTPQPIASVNTPKSFQPAQDQRVSPEQARKFQESSVALLALQEQWIQKIEKAEGQEKILLLQNLAMARDQVCARVGLSGYEEYSWIQNVLSLPQNKAVVENIGIIINQ